MENVTEFLTLFMPVVGLLQVLSGLLFAIFTKTHKVRKHYLIYLGGVLLYFLILDPVLSAGDDPRTFWKGLYFFGVAGFLMFYHLYGLPTFKHMKRS